MSYPPSYFSREKKIKTHGQMLETLKTRTQSCAESRSLEGEIWLAKRFQQQCGQDIFDGITDSTERRIRLRAGIKEQGLEYMIVGAKEGKPINWREAFQRLYHEAL